MDTAVSVSTLFEIRWAAVYALRRKPLVTQAILEALLWHVLHFDETWTKRQTVQKFVRKVSDEKIRRAMLKPYPPFPMYLVFSRSRYLKRGTFSESR